MAVANSPARHTLAPNVSVASSSATATVRAPALAAVRRVFRGVAWQAGNSWQYWGLDSKVLKSTKDHATEYNMTIKIHLPMAWSFGSHVLRGELGVSFPRQNTLTLRHPSYFAVARVLDESPPFMAACKSDDAVTVRRMLGTGEVRPTDEDDFGFVLLFVSTVVTQTLSIPGLMMN